MANLSQQRREKMLAFLETLKEQHSDDDSLIAIGEIEKELKAKKYGLVWEEHEEAVDVQMKTQIPVFTEVKEREICTNENGAYNFLLEGDNLHSLYLLEKTHRGKIDVIYIDPPYNTGGKDFVYDDKYVNSEDSFRHSKWISFMERRLRIAQKLLTNKGVIFISIDDNELYQLKMLCDDILGAENFVANLIWAAGRKNDSKYISISHEYMLCYAKGCCFHGVPEMYLQAQVLAKIQNVLNYARSSPKEFKQNIQKLLIQQADSSKAVMEEELKKAQTRTAEIDKYIQGLFEAKVRGEIDGSLFASLKKTYDEEKEQLNKLIIDFITKLSRENEANEKIQLLYSAIRKYDAVWELTPEVLTDFIEKIEVGQVSAENKKISFELRDNKISVFFWGVGIINFI